MSSADSADTPTGGPSGTTAAPPQHHDDDLTALARTFNRLFDRIEKLLQANKQVSADIAHDLRKHRVR